MPIAVTVIGAAAVVVMDLSCQSPSALARDTRMRSYARIFFRCGQSGQFPAVPEGEAVPFYERGLVQENAG